MKNFQLAVVLFVVIVSILLLDSDCLSQDKPKADTTRIKNIIVKGKIIRIDSAKIKPPVVSIEFDGVTFYREEDGKVFFLTPKGEKNYIKKLPTPTK